MKVKYMGSADVRLIEAGENFGGRLATPVAETLRWDKDNNWVVDTDEAGLSAEAVALLLQEAGFLDVSDKEVIPVNVHQSTFLGMKDAEPVEAPAVETAVQPRPRGAVSDPVPPATPNA